MLSSTSSARGGRIVTLSPPRSSCSFPKEPFEDTSALGSRQVVRRNFVQPLMVEITASISILYLT